MQVDDVGHARAIDVSQADTSLIELIGRVEPWGVVHRDFGSEASVAQVRPVAYLAVANAHEVGQAVAGHVGEIDRLAASGEDQPRPLLLIPRRRPSCRPSRSPLPPTRDTRSRFVLNYQDIGMAVTREVHEP